MKRDLEVIRWHFWLNCFFRCCFFTKKNFLLAATCHTLACASSAYAHQQFNVSPGSFNIFFSNFFFYILLLLSKSRLPTYSYIRKTKHAHLILWSVTQNVVEIIILWLFTWRWLDCVYVCMWTHIWHFLSLLHFSNF